MNSDAQLLAGKVAIVTGAGRGLGEAISRLLAKRGAAVMLTDMKKKIRAKLSPGTFNLLGEEQLSCIMMSRKNLNGWTLSSKQ